MELPTHTAACHFMLTCHAGLPSPRTSRSCADKLAYAVHAYLLVQGFKLVAAGRAAEDEDQGEALCFVAVLLGLPILQRNPLLCPADFAAQREEVGSEGWADLDGAYAFRYQDTDGEAAA